MAAGTYNFTIEQGATLNKQFLWTDGSSVPINLTGWSARMQIRQTVSSNQVIAEWRTDTTPATIVLGGSAGTITLVVTAVATAALSFPGSSGASLPTAVYDLELVDASGNVTRLLKGTITLDLEVTR